MATVDAQRINQDSGEQEYYTPSEIVFAAREALGRIDLDPASSEQANRLIGAGTFFTREMDGLSREWFGNVWMNHPFGRIENPRWVQKMLREYREGRVKAACLITFACTSESWFQPLLRHPQCFLSPRTNFVTPTGGVKRGVTKGSVVTYLGPDVESFCRAFRRLGVVKTTLPYRGGESDGQEQ